jgi:hypothetical protein
VIPVKSAQHITREYRYVYGSHKPLYILSPAKQASVSITLSRSYSLVYDSIVDDLDPFLGHL